MSDIQLVQPNFTNISAQNVNKAFGYISDCNLPLKVVLPVNYERARDNGLLLFLTTKLGIITWKQDRAHIGNVLRLIYLLQKSIRAYKQKSIIPCALIVHSSRFWKDNLD